MCLTGLSYYINKGVTTKQVIQIYIQFLLVTIIFVIKVGIFSFRKRDLDKIGLNLLLSRSLFLYWCWREKGRIEWSFVFFIYFFPRHEIMASLDWYNDATIFVVTSITSKSKPKLLFKSLFIHLSAPRH